MRGVRAAAAATAMVADTSADTPWTWGMAEWVESLRVLQAMQNGG